MITIARSFVAEAIAFLYVSLLNRFRKEIAKYNYSNPKSFVEFSLFLALTTRERLIIFIFENKTAI
ncbi:MAG: hypothetical protein PUP92_25465 [Rhizonema sp. PD38]|nr:hypothetical protein [Rhizonema sp. PD38]